MIDIPIRLPFIKPALNELSKNRVANRYKGVRIGLETGGSVSRVLIVRLKGDRNMVVLEQNRKKLIAFEVIAIRNSDIGEYTDHLGYFEDEKEANDIAEIERELDGRSADRVFVNKIEIELKKWSK